jgi:GMP synthase-like glutamine amidotransferase
VVGNNPAGRFKLGIDRMEWAPAIDTTRWPETSAESVIIESHGECVLHLPPKSTHLASSSTITNEIFLVEDRFLVVQGHPEVNSEWLQQGSMPVHRTLFDDEQWRVVEHESRQPISPEPVIALARRPLAEGVL